MMNKKQFLWALLLSGFSLQAFAQDPIAERFAGEITTKRSKKHLKILASDKFEGRETGKRGAQLAANYIAREFKKLGLVAPVNGSYFQTVPLVQTSFQVSSISVNDQPLTVGKDFGFSGNGPAKTINTNEIVFIGYGIGADNYDDLKNVDIKDKVVMMIGKGEPTANGISAISKTATPSDWTTSRFKRLQYVMTKSPALIINVIRIMLQPSRTIGLQRED